jgi:general secretion pathway protein L
MAAAQVQDGAARVVMAPEQAPDWLRGRNFLPSRPVLRLPLSRPVVLALLLALLLPGLAQHWRRERLEDQLAEARRGAAETVRLSRDLASHRAGLSPLEIERAERPSVSLLLADLTGALPAAAYLDDLAVDGQSVTVSGYAASAAELIPALTQGGRFTDVHFTGAVTRESDRGLERFQIAALYSGAAAP